MIMFKIAAFTFLVSFSALSVCQAQAVDIDSVKNLNLPSPRSIVQAQRASNSEIDYMIENYSLPELARFAVQLNQQQIKEAEMRGATPPARLTKAILADKQKIGEYLRSFYKFSY